MNPDRFRLLALALLGVIVLAAAVVWVENVTAAPSAAQRAGETARRYASATTLWNSGPRVRQVRIVPLSGLEGALHGSVSPRVAADVNVSDLEHRFGPSRQVALVVLHGVFNTLPPDEGVIVSADMVAIVDTRSQRVLLLTD